MDIIKIEGFLTWIAFISTTIFVLMTIASMTTGGVDVDLDGEVDADGEEGGLQIFTIKNLLAVLMGIGWVSKSMLHSGNTVLVSLCVGIVAGCILAVAQSMLFILIMKLDYSVKDNYNDLIGKTAHMLVSMGPKGNGKIHVMYKERLTVFNARSNDTEKLTPGDLVVITGVSEEGIIFVEKY